MIKLLNNLWSYLGYSPVQWQFEMFTKVTGLIYWLNNCGVLEAVSVKDIKSTWNLDNSERRKQL